MRLGDGTPGRAYYVHAGRRGGLVRVRLYASYSRAYRRSSKLYLYQLGYRLQINGITQTLPALPHRSLQLLPLEDQPLSKEYEAEESKRLVG